MVAMVALAPLVADLLSEVAGAAGVELEAPTATVAPEPSPASLLLPGTAATPMPIPRPAAPHLGHREALAATAATVPSLTPRMVPVEELLVATAEIPASAVRPAATAELAASTSAAAVGVAVVEEALPARQIQVGLAATLATPSRVSSESRTIRRLPPRLRANRRPSS